MYLSAWLLRNLGYIKERRNRGDWEGNKFVRVMIYVVLNV